VGRVRRGQAALIPDMIRDAEISACGTWRYVLNRRWDRVLPVMGWVALNPSTADGEVDDTSVGRMCGFAVREGCGGICLLNMYGLRATDPAVLRRHVEDGRLPDPVGPDNDRWLAGLAAAPDGPVVVAWGEHAARPWARDRRAAVLGILTGVPLWCLGVTASGEPRHPCRLDAATPLVRWPASGGACG
jgi:hypothetical protein